MHVILIAAQSPTKSCHQAFSALMLLFLATIAYLVALAYCPTAHAAVKWTEFGFSYFKITVSPPRPSQSMASIGLCSSMK